MTPPSAAEAPLLRLLGEQGGLLTAGEAAARSGLPLEQAERGLLALAVAAGADLRVGHDGSVAYRFPRHLRRRLLARSWRRRLEASLRRLWHLGVVLVRLSIGTVLLLLVLVVSLILLVAGLVQLLRSDDGIEAIGQLLLGNLEGLVRGLASLRLDRRTRDRTPPAAPGEWRTLVLPFLDAAFSVLFGDGDPNSDREQRRWSRIGCFLRHRHGAVIAEDLSPLLDLPLRPSDGEHATAIADAAMLPVLLRFDGRPEVSDRGDLAYHFPALQVDAAPAVSARGPARKAARELPSPPLRERRLRFSRTTSGQRRIYFILSTALLVLAPMLFDLIRPTPAALAALGHFAIGYALILLLLPLLRLPFLRWRNRRIERRNHRRRSWARLHGPAAASLERRRLFARTFARRSSVSEVGLAYTTEEGLLEQQIAAVPPVHPD
jgi:hypothetical protein